MKITYEWFTMIYWLCCTLWITILIEIFLFVMSQIKSLRIVQLNFVLLGLFQPFLLYSVALVTGCLRLQTWVEFRAAGYLYLPCVSFIISWQLHKWENILSYFQRFGGSKIFKNFWHLSFKWPLPLIESP